MKTREEIRSFIAALRVARKMASKFNAAQAGIMFDACSECLEWVLREEGLEEGKQV